MRLFFIVIFAICSLNAATQTLQQIKELWNLNNLETAKNAIDQLVLTDNQNIEALLLKANIYESIAADIAYKDLVADARKTSLTSIQNAINVDVTKITELLKESNFLIIKQIKEGYTNDGVAFFNAGIEKKNKNDFVTALANFKKALTAAKLLNDNNWGGTAIDTALLYQITLSAINADKEQDAYINAIIIANNGLKNYDKVISFEYVYEWLVQYCRQNNFEDALIKYTSIANALYPNSIYYTLNLIKWYSSNNNWQKALEMYKSLNLLDIKNEPITTGYLNLKFNQLYTNLSLNINKAGFEIELNKYSMLFKNANIILLLGKFYTNEAKLINVQPNKSLNSKIVKAYTKANYFFKKIINLKNIEIRIFNTAVKLYADNLFALKQGSKAKEVLNLTR